MQTTAAIVVIGDELLSGKFRDENAAFLIGELRALGVELRRIEFIPDDPDDIGATVRRVAAGHDWVFTSGGIGPTHDDVTIAAIATAYDVEVVRDPSMMKLVEEHFGDAATPAHMRLADVPEGATVTFRDAGRWPAIEFHNLLIMPGIPVLFRYVFSIVAERLRGTPNAVVRVYFTGDESAHAEAIGDVARAHPTTKIGSYPRWDGEDHSVIVTVEGTASDDVARAADAIRQRLADHWVRTERE